MDSNSMAATLKYSVNSSDPVVMTNPKENQKKEIAWVPTLFIGFMHLGSLAAFFTFSWDALILCLVLHWITGGLGITLTYHRLLTHRSFKVPKFFEYILSVLGCLACQGGPIAWVSDHRLHHAESDKENDPHTPLQGLFWAHMGWCLHKNQVFHNEKAREKTCPDLISDPVHVFINKFHIGWTILLAGILYAWGGWSYVVWGIFVRTTLVYHSTWLVNSAAHVWGYRTYVSGDRSTNNWWVALVTYGEGWHNNHHAFQYSARHGLKWWEVDATYLTIKVLEFFKLAKAIRTPSKNLLSKSHAPGKKIIQ